MNKKYLKSVFAFALVGAMLTSCQDEDIENIGEDSTQELSIEVKHPTTKAAVGKKFSEVYFLTSDFESFHKYKTIKIRNVKGTICQEWFYEDLHEDWFRPYSFQPSDEDGIIHGYYYPWEGVLNNVPQSDWDEMIFNEDGDNETGFHIPTLSDIHTLSDLFGETSAIRTVLNVAFDGTYIPQRPDDWNNFTASFWKDPVDPIWFSAFPNFIDPNKQEGCGKFVSWYQNNYQYGNYMWINNPNNKDLRCNVRLVRTITKQQW